MHERRVSTPEIIREEVFHLNPLKDPQQREFTMLIEDKSKNGKRNPTTEITGKKERKIIKKKENLEKLHEVPEKTS
jgi:hypothetical protein